MFSNKNQLNEFFYTTDGTATKTSEKSNTNLQNTGEIVNNDGGVNNSTSLVVNDENSRNNIINKIMKIQEQKEDSVSDQLRRQYHLSTNSLIDNNTASINVNKFNVVQKRQISNNNIKLNKLQNDILTVRKLIEHNENNYQLKQDQLYILKNIFFCLVIVIILIALSNVIDGYAPPAMNNIGGMGITKLIALCICGMFMVKIAFYYYTHRLRNNVISRKYDWPDPSDLQKSEKNIDVSQYKIRALTCTPGSHPSKQNPTRCVQNKCRCDNGVAKRGKECEWDTVNNIKLYKQDCKKCNAGYTLVDRKCILNNSTECKTNQ
tara:strand:- start:1788 stop:2747 length:960 start_codon:yes stop_codon:yes gene_type:complete